MREAGEASDAERLIRISIGCLSSTASMIIGVKMIRRVLGTALSLRVIVMRSEN